MAQAFKAGFVNDLASAYQFAVRNDPELGEEIEKQRLEEARKRALEEAAARSEQTAAAKAASRNIGGKGIANDGGKKRRLSISDAIKQAAGT
jgi:hypothetical protein